MSSSNRQRYEILATVTLSQTLVAGLFVYSFSVLQLPIAEEFGAPRSLVSVTVSGAMALNALLAPFTGRVLDGGSIRRLMLLGAVGMSSGYVAASLSTSLLAVLVFYAIASAIGVQCLGNLVASKLVTSWFTGNRGFALGIAALGTSFGGLLAPPAMALAVEHFGWRTAIGGGGLLSLVIAGLPVLFWIRDRPRDEGGVGPYAAGSAPDPGAAPVSEDWPARRLLRDRSFWSLAIFLGMVNSVTAAVISHLVPIAVEQGVEIGAAARLVSVLSLAAIVGKLALGFLMDRIDERWVMAFTLALLVSFLVLLAGGPSPGTFAWAATLPGFALGGALPLWGRVVGSYYGAESMGRAMGLMSPLVVSCQVGAVQLLPWIYDRESTYVPACYALLLGLGLAFVALATLRRPRPASASAG